MSELQLGDFEKVFKGWKPVPLGNYRFYSVLVPLIEKEGKLFLLYEVRAETLKIQPGEVCFPGGRLEEDESLQECAVRETCEELNLYPGQIRIIAQLNYIHTYSNFAMYPFLGVINYETFENITVSREEVKEVFLVPLSYFLETEPLTLTYEVAPMGIEDFPHEKINFKGAYKWRKGKTTIPIYHYQGWTIWGLTARITRNLIEIMQRYS